MEQFVQSIAANSYLQALSILVAIATGIYGVYSVRESILAVCKFLGDAVFPSVSKHVWQPQKILKRHACLSQKNPSYFVARLYINLLYLLFFIACTALSSEIYLSLVAAEGESENSNATCFFRYARIAFAAVAGIRFSEMLTLVRWVIQGIELEGRSSRD